LRRRCRTPVRRRIHHEGQVPTASGTFDGYVYSLRIGHDEAGEFAAWHWQPREGPTRLHLHVRVDHEDVSDFRDMHLPSARVFSRTSCSSRFTI
jgi:hypothetical protein